MDELNTTQDPNFSIIVPGICNGRCKFCFWYKDAEIKSLVINKYIHRLNYVLYALPSRFYQISLTGGEPTISPYLPKILKCIARHRDKFTKVVLTTNGKKLRTVVNQHRAVFEKTVDFVNISRHAGGGMEGDIKNNEIFDSPQIRASYPHSLKIVIDQLNLLGVEVTANCVLVGQFKEVVDLTNFLYFAKRTNFSGVCFRKVHKDKCTLAPTKEEKWFSHYAVNRESSCPVCRATTQIIRGIPVTWSASIPEPSQALDSIFELIFHPNGELTIDWNRKTLVEI